MAIILNAMPQWSINYSKLGNQIRKSPSLANTLSPKKKNHQIASVKSLDLTMAHRQKMKDQYHQIASVALKMNTMIQYLRGHNHRLNCQSTVIQLTWSTWVASCKILMWLKRRVESVSDRQLRACRRLISSALTVSNWQVRRIRVKSGMHRLLTLVGMENWKLWSRLCHRRRNLQQW